jgi:isopentenyl diphosphate isomerase/L-lactate dehydrogenase-like FMN-dependent dehydrogenase
MSDADSQYSTAANRRRFLKFLAGSGAVALSGRGELANALEAPNRLPDPMVWSPRDLDHLIASPKDAINVFDFESVMRKNVPPAHFGYMASGIDDEVTLRANREGFLKFQLRPRRLVDVSKVDMSMELFGQKYATPIMLAPTGGHRGYHPDGEIATAKGAKSGNHAMIVSTQMSYPIEEITAARGAPLWFQLYATNKFEVAKHHVERAEKAGCVAVAVTVDRSGGRNQETLFRLQRTDTRTCSDCHEPAVKNGQMTQPKAPMYDGVDVSGLPNIQASAMTWDYLKRIRDATKMKCVIKGILTAEDARIAADNGYDAVIVSNHGGRADEAGSSTIETLPEVIEAVGGRMPVLIDSGFRRGTDIVKALAMGATGVAVGRPYLWGLGAFGEAGVTRVLELLRIELLAAMQQAGAPTVKHLVPAMVRHV